MKPIDKIALLLTATVCLIIVAAVAAPIVEGRVLDESRAEMLSNIVSSLIAIISIYVGSKLRGKDEN